MAGRRQFHHQQPVTEYDRNYKSYQFVPQTLAGKESFKMHMTQEPPLQRKRRIDPPGAEQDENYLLVGKSTEKFGPALLYRDKNPLRDSLKDKQMKRHNSMERREKVHKENTKNGYRSEDFALNLTPDTAQVASQVNDETSKRIQEGKTHSKNKNFNNVHKRQDEKQAQNIRKEHHPIQKNPSRSRSAERSQGNQLKFTQRPQTAIARQSEYQGNFNWKQKGLAKLYKQAPLLRTEDIFYRSHLNAPKNVKMPWNTEYRQNYKPYQFITEDEYKRRQSILDKHHVDNPPLETRVRPVIVTVDQRRARTPSPDRKGIEKIEVDGHTYTASNILNPQRLGFPLGPRRMVLSEYQSNYKNFWKPLLESGNMGRSLPQEVKQKNVPVEREVSKSYDATALSLDDTAWLQELHELRKRAQEHKKRARGSHFSREHMAQLLSHENRYWDIPSSARLAHHAIEEGQPTNEGDYANNGIGSVRENSPHENSVRLSLESYESDEESVAPNEEYGMSKHVSNKRTHKKRLNKSNINAGKHVNEKKSKTPSLTSSCSTFLDRNQDKVYDDRKYRTGSQYSTSETSSRLKDIQNTEPARSKVKASQNFNSIEGKTRKMTPSPVRIPMDIAGRLSTPKMPEGKYQRHHADRTTPNIGGAILTAPNGNNTSKNVTAWNEETSEKYKDNISTLSHMRVSPAGKPTLDAHVLADEPQYSHYIKKSCNNSLSDDQITSVSSLSQRNFDDLFESSHAKQPVGFVYSGTSVLKPPSMVSNELSLSVRSNPSSCRSSSTHSLALETLERAKKRKEELYGK